MSDTDKEKLIKDTECIHCARFFDCEGKPKGSECLHFLKRGGEECQTINGITG